MTERKALESWLRAMFRDWLDGLSDSQIAALAGHWSNIMDDAALFRADSWAITEKAVARLRDDQPETGEDARHDQDHETRKHRTGDTSMKNHSPLHRGADKDASAEKAEQDQLRVNKKVRGETPLMGRRDRSLRETLPDSGPLQDEGTWKSR